MGANELKLSLRWKMLLLIFALILIPTLVLGFNDYRTSKNLLSKNLQDNAREILHGSADAVDMFLKSLEESIMMMSKDVNIQNILSDDQAEEWMYYTFVDCTEFAGHV